MTEKELLEKLKSLETISPGAEYARFSRLTILKTGRRPLSLSLPQNIFSQTFTFGLSIALTALFLLMIFGESGSNFRGLVVAKLLGVESLIVEAGSVTPDIDIHLEEALYLASLADRTEEALEEAAGDGPPHINPAVIEKEAADLNFKEPTNEIDNLLDQAD